MKTYFLLILIVSMVVSCNRNEIKTYYSNGSIKSITYHKPKNQVLSIFYYPNGVVKKKEKIIDSTLNITEYDLDRNVRLRGNAFILNNKSEIRIGKWIFSTKKTDSIVEYKNIDNKSYANQYWTMNKNGDTILERSNFYKKIIQQKTSVNKPTRIKFYLEAPYYYADNVELIYSITRIKKDGKEEDYGTFTQLSMEHDGVSRGNVPEDFPSKYVINLNQFYDHAGHYEISGYLTEYIFTEIDGSSKKVERRLYFDENIVVVK